jgi:predicted permease
MRLTGRNVLVATQVALSLVLVTISVFTAQAFRRILGDGPGFRTSQMAKLTIDPGQAGYRDDEVSAFFDRLLADARQTPGAESVGVTSAMPLFSFEMATIAPEGERSPDGQPTPPVISNRVDEGFFDAMAIPVVRGRAFLATDTAITARVAIVNETLAAHYWPGDDPLGKRFRLLVAAPPPAARPGLDAPAGHGGAGRAGEPWVEVVGVARTSRYWFPGENPQRAVYFPYRQLPAGRMALLAATAGDSTSVIAPIRDLVRRLDPDVPVYDAQSIEDYYDARATSFANVLLKLVTAMGVMGLVLTLTGLYGLVSYAASRRTREIGIRMAIGASPGRVLAMILRQGMTPAGAGLVCGVVLSLIVAELLAGNVPLTFAYEPRALFAVVPLLISVTAFAAFLPARRASRIAPTEALRTE